MLKKYMRVFSQIRKQNPMTNLYKRKQLSNLPKMVKSMKKTILKTRVKLKNLNVCCKVCFWSRLC